MVDYSLADHLQGRAPVMPEAYDRVRGELRDENPVAPHARAFGAGLIDPMGVPSWLWDAYQQSINSRWYKDRMQEARDESPIASGIGSSVLPYMAGGGVARAAGELTRREFWEGLPLFMQLGLGVGGMKGSIFPPANKQRPQAAYPPSGAY